MNSLKEEIEKIVTTNSLKDSTNPTIISEEILKLFEKRIDILKHLRKGKYINLKTELAIGYLEACQDMKGFLK